MSLPKTQHDAVTANSSEADLSLRERVNGYYELTKPRLSFMSVLTAIIGYLAADPSRDFIVLSSLIIGTSLAAGGAAVLNQWLEREADAKMERTKDRPIPSGQVIPYNALISQELHPVFVSSLKPSNHSSLPTSTVPLSNPA